MLDLVYPRVGDGPGERDQRRAGLLGGAELAKPRGAVAPDQREVGEGLDVADERGAPAHAPFEGPRRGEGRQAGPPERWSTSADSWPAT